MLPFFPLSLPNPIQTQGANDPACQQAMLVNPVQFPPFPQGLNQFQTSTMPNFDNQNTHLGVFNRNAVATPNRPPSMPPPSFHNGPNGPSVVQNNPMGILPLPGHWGLNQAAQNLNQVMALQMLGQSSNLQHNMQLHGQLQNLNFLASMQSAGVLWGNNQPQNLNQIAGLQNGQICLQNPMLQGNQIMPFQCPVSSMQVSPLNITPSSHPLGICLDSANPGIVGKPQMAQDISNANFSKTAMTGQTAKHGSSTANHNFHRFNHRSPMKSDQSARNLQPYGQHKPRLSYICGGNDMSQVISANSKSNNFTRNLHGRGERELSHQRLQKSQFHHTKGVRGNKRPFTGPGSRGQRNWREMKPPLEQCINQASIESKRRLPVTYTESEIETWREARRRNFPTRANIEKKLATSNTSSQDADGDAKLRRQQLKEILAKQAELGVEVAEIPISYLSEHESQASEKVNNSQLNMTNRYQNRYNNKRGKYGRDRCHAKKPKFCGEASLTVRKREPTLLQKLLSADIRRDKSRMLQVFKFMLLNSFFEQGSDKPLEFPLVTVKDTGFEDLAGGNKKSLNVAGIADSEAGTSTLVEEVKCQKDLSVVNEAEGGSSEEDSSSDKEEVDGHFMGKEDYVADKCKNAEEGEITE